LVDRGAKEQWQGQAVSMADPAGLVDRLVVEIDCPVD
jgi:hypothetical protein